MQLTGMLGVKTSWVEVDSYEGIEKALATGTADVFGISYVLDLDFADSIQAWASPVFLHDGSTIPVSCSNQAFGEKGT